LSFRRNAIREKRHNSCHLREAEKQREKRRLPAVMMVVVVMVVVMGPGSERGTCKHQQEQRCCKQFLHESNPSTKRFTGGITPPRYVYKK
jgi:hypothetical protein